MPALFADVRLLALWIFLSLALATALLAAFLIPALMVQHSEGAELQNSKSALGKGPMDVRRNCERGYHGVFI